MGKPDGLDNRFDGVSDFKRVFEELYAPLLRFARLSVELEEAEEIVQDVFLSFWVKRGQVAIQEDSSSYLFGAVKNRVASYIRHEQVVRKNDLSRGGQSPVGMGQPPESPDWAIIEDESKRAYKRALADLSPLQREVITLRWEESMSYEEIARILSISPTAAKQNGSRAQRALRIALGEKII